MSAWSHGKASAGIVGLGSSFDQRIARASQQEGHGFGRSPTPSPSHHSWAAEAHRPSAVWSCGGSLGCGQRGNSAGFCQGCGQQWGHWQIASQTKPWPRAAPRAKVHTTNSFQALQDEPAKPSTSEPAPWRRIGKGRGQDKKEGGKSKGKGWGKQKPLLTSSDEEGALNDRPTSGEDMAVDQGCESDLPKLRGAFQACSQAFGPGHDITLQAHMAYQSAWQAKQALVPLHIQLQKVQRKLGQATKKVESCHSEFEALELSVKEAVVRMQEVKEMGRKCEGELAAVEAEKAGILQAMQAPAEQGESTTTSILKGLGPLSLEQLQALGEHIRLACKPLEQQLGPTQPTNQGGGTATPTQKGPKAALDRPRSRSPRASGDSDNIEFTAKDLGLEGAQGQQFDQEQKVAAAISAAAVLQMQQGRP